MSPCSLDPNLPCVLEMSSDDKSVTKEQSSNLAKNLGHVIDLLQSNSRQNVNSESSLTNMAGASEVDSGKLEIPQQHFDQSGCSNCIIVISIHYPSSHISTDKPVHLSVKPCASKERKELLQREITKYFDNPIKNREHHECNEQPEPENVAQHPEPQNDENDELCNDSGFGSSGCHQRVVLDNKNDLDNLSKNLEELSQCCFYYGPINSQTSSHLLRKKPTGTFLLRDSSDPRYLYSLSVKTEKGATSIRILYSNGYFQFDSDERIRHKLPRFETVLALLNFHVKVTEEGGNKLWRWEEVSGCKSLKVVLIAPLRKSVPRLGQLARVKVNKCMNNLECPQLSVDKLPTDFDCVKEVLRKYPYQL